MSVNLSDEQFANLPPELSVDMQCYSDYVRNQPRWDISKVLWKIYDSHLKNQGIEEGIHSYKLGETIALTSYQAWLYPESSD